MVVGDEEVELVEPRWPCVHACRSLPDFVDVVDHLPGHGARRPRRGRSPPRRRWAAGRPHCGSGWPTAMTMATGYALQRTQFGRLIGSFQALKHLLADAQVQVEVARAAVQAADVGVDGLAGHGEHGTSTGPSTLPASWHRAPPTAPPVHALQVHGGMGFTWEHDALYLKRALVLDAGIGSPDEAVESLAGAL